MLKCIVYFNTRDLNLNGDRQYLNIVKITSVINCVIEEWKV